MKKTTIQFALAGLGVALLGAGLTEGGPVEAVRRGVQAVFVTNGPNHPVPVVLQGDLVGTVGISPSANAVMVANTPTVNVASLPAVQLQGTPLVLAGDPAPAAAIQAQATCPQPCGGDIVEVTLFTVPAGKRLVIEHTSAFVSLTGGGQALYSLRTAIDQSYLGGTQYSGASLTHLLGPATAAGATYSVSNALRLYADPGTTVTFQVSIQTATGSVDYVLASLSGYLVDA